VADSIIYVDHAGTTPVHPDVRDAMAPFLSAQFGNPSSLHGLGRAAEHAVNASRADVATVLNARPGELIFTSGGSESVNTALKGVAFAQQHAGVGQRIVSTSIEHHAILHSLDYLERFGFEIVRLEVDADGFVEPDAVAAAVDEQTVLVSVMLANNEVGAIEPIAEIAAALRARGEQLGRRVPFHTDAIQGAGQLDLDVQKLDVDLLSLSAHKFRGPKGAGALYLRRGTPFLAQQTGGGQERNRRAGTENVPGIVGLARALAIAEASRPVFVERISALRDHFIDRTLNEIPHAILNGPATDRLPNNANVRFDSVDGQLLLEALDEVGIAASSGSACTTSSWEPSHVLLAMGADQDAAAGSLRVTLGGDSAQAELDTVVDQLKRIVPALRGEPATSPATGTPA
jgi:cysteine desulfurase